MGWMEFFGIMACIMIPFILGSVIGYVLGGGSRCDKCRYKSAYYSSFKTPL